ncbi:MAG: phosphoribosylglycinamide formyltransferase [Candidatus Puniceispirillaceae bacterium]
MSSPLKIAILISGRGSNMTALAEAAKQRDDIDILLVAANKQAEGLEYAAAAGLNTALVQRADYDSKSAHEAAMLAEIRHSGADWVFLAGYMALLSADFIDALSGRIVNIHPSLLPAHKGLNTHQRALDAGDSQHGLSVHLVTPGMDEGPLVLQLGLAVQDGDTADSLAKRVLALEHLAYPAVMLALATGALEICSDRPVWHQPPVLTLPQDAFMRLGVDF